MNNKFFILLSKIFNIKNYSNEQIVARNRKHLNKLIEKEINLYGFNCNLNYIDVSNVTDMTGLFKSSKFNGDISQWDVSNVIDMKEMFYKSDFNGDLSNWNVSNVKYMYKMFAEAYFDGDISQWNVSNVTDMRFVFTYSKFKQDIENWKPFSLETLDFIFHNSDGSIPYWNNFLDQKERNKAIESYSLNKELNNDLLENKITTIKRMKL